MPEIADAVAETTTTTGTGAVALAGAKTGYRPFSAAFVNGTEVYYVIRGGAEFEAGVGVYNAPALSRSTVLTSSNAGALVNFSAGVKDVFCSAVSDALAPLGPYPNTTALQVAKPAAKYVGRVALVGSSAPFSPYLSTGAAWAEVLAAAGGGSGATVRSFTAAVPFDLDYSYFSAQVTGPIAFSLDAAGAVVGGWALYELVADGFNVPTFAPTFVKQSSSGVYNNTAGRVNLVAFFKGAYGYTYTIAQGGTASLPDVTAPVMTARTALTKNTIAITFSEPVLASGVAGWSFSRGAALTATSVAGSGSNTLTFTISQDMLTSDTITVAYTPGTVTDVAINPLAAFGATAVTNLIPPADAVAPTVVSRTATGPNTVVVVFSENVTATTAGWTITAGSSLGVASLTGSGTSTITFTTTTAIPDGQAVTISYAPGATTDIAGNALASFTSAPVTIGTPLTFATQANLATVGTVFTKSGTAVDYGGRGLDSKVLPANAPGRVWAKNLSSSGVPDCLIGFNTSASAVSLASSGYALAWHNGAATIGACVSGAFAGTSNVGSWAANNLVGVTRKASGQIWIQKSTDDGVTWTDVYNTGLNTQAALYPVCFVQGALYAPQGFGVV